MTAPGILPMDAARLDALLRLNNAHARELSALTGARLAQLVGIAFLARRIGEADALLLAFEQDADYDSPNFLWFRARYARFVYIDRVAVSPAQRGQGLARALYEEVFARARMAGHSQVVCEVNAEPPNPASDAFHAALCFVAVDSALLPDKSRTVRYFSRALT